MLQNMNRSYGQLFFYSFYTPSLKIYCAECIHYVERFIDQAYLVSITKKGMSEESIGSRQSAVGSWRLAVGGWQLAVGNGQLAVGSWQ